MFLLEINWVAVAVSFVVVFIAGALWFSPKAFYPVWRRLMNVPGDEALGSHGMTVVFGSTALAALVQTVAVTSVVYFVSAALGPVGPLGGALTGLLLGIGFAAASSLSHRLFAGHGFRVWAIEVGSDTVNYVLVGLIVGLFGS